MLSAVVQLSWLVLTAPATPRVATLSYQGAELDDMRPYPVKVEVQAAGNDFELRLEFNRPPAGGGCGRRCATSTILLDTDNDRRTGFTPTEPSSAEAGADLAVTIQGRESLAAPGVAQLRVLVRRLADGTTTLDDGARVAELSPHDDGERLRADGNKLTMKLDMAATDAPSGAVARVVYRPPGAEPVSATLRGTTGRGVPRERGGRSAHLKPKPAPTPAGANGKVEILKP